VITKKQLSKVKRIKTIEVFKNGYIRTIFIRNPIIRFDKTSIKYLNKNDVFTAQIHNNILIFKPKSKFKTSPFLFDIDTDNDYISLRAFDEDSIMFELYNATFPSIVIKTVIKESSITFKKDDLILSFNYYINSKRVGTSLGQTYTLFSPDQNKRMAVDREAFKKHLLKLRVKQLLKNEQKSLQKKYCI